MNNILSYFFKVDRENLAKVRSELVGNKWFWVSMALSFIIMSAVFVWSLWEYLSLFLLGLLLLISDGKIMFTFAVFFGGMLVALLMAKAVLEGIIHAMPDGNDDLNTPTRKTTTKD